MKRIISNINQWPALTLLVMERWKKRPKPFEVILKSAPKTWEQLAYLHATVLPILTEALFDSGEIRKKTERDAKYWLKREMNYGVWIEYEGGKVFDPDSFEDADIDVLSAAIDLAITECEKREYFVPKPRKGK